VTSLTVAVCTRNRPRHAEQALAALDHQVDPRFEILVVDQSDADDQALHDRIERNPSVRALRSTGRGLSRARNAALAATTTAWIAFVDDDCLVDPAWVAELRAALERHPGVAFVSGTVGTANVPAGDHLAAAARPVPQERVLSGRHVWPQHIGFGVCMAVRHDVAVRLGGWDERLGAGTPDFPAAEDMDFNYRLLRAGEAALVTPRMRADHDQWRTPDETVRLYEGYARSWAAFAMKHVRSGDRRGGLWLWSIGLRGQARMWASAVRHRSGLRGRVAAAQARGLVAGTVRGLARAW
jgi:GT2 family glycosyltransferase